MRLDSLRRHAADGSVSEAQNQPVRQFIQNLQNSDATFFKEAFESLRQLTQRPQLQAGGVTTAQNEAPENAILLTRKSQKDLPQDFPQTEQLSLEKAWLAIPEQHRYVIEEIVTGEVASVQKIPTAVRNYIQYYGSTAPEGVNPLALDPTAIKSLSFSSVEVQDPHADKGYLVQRVMIITVTPTTGKPFDIYKFTCQPCDSGNCETLKDSSEWFEDSQPPLKSVSFGTFTSDSAVVTTHTGSETTVTFQTPDEEVQTSYNTTENWFTKTEHDPKNWLNPLADSKTQNASLSTRYYNEESSSVTAQATTESTEPTQVMTDEEKMNSAPLLRFLMDSLETPNFTEQVDPILTAQYQLGEEASKDPERYINFKNLYYFMSNGEKEVRNFFEKRVTVLASLNSEENENTETNDGQRTKGGFSVEDKPYRKPVTFETKTLIIEPIFTHDYRWKIVHGRGPDGSASEKQEITIITQKDKIKGKDTLREYAVLVDPLQTDEYVASRSLAVYETEETKPSFAAVVKTGFGDNIVFYEILSSEENFPKVTVKAFDSSKQEITIPKSFNTNTLVAYLSETHKLANDLDFGELTTPKEKGNKNPAAPSSVRLSLYGEAGPTYSSFALADQDFNLTPVNSTLGFTGGAFLRGQWQPTSLFGISADVGGAYHRATYETSRSGDDLTMQSVAPYANAYSTFFFGNVQVGLGGGGAYRFFSDPNGSVDLTETRTLEGPMKMLRNQAYSPQLAAFASFGPVSVGAVFHPYPTLNRFASRPYTTPIGEGPTAEVTVQFTPLRIKK